MAMNDASIPSRWRPVTRAVWLALVLLLLAIFIAGISPYYRELSMTCTAGDCQLMALSPQEVQALRDLGLSLEFYARYIAGFDIFAAVIFILFAGLIFWRRSDSWMGFLLSLGLVFFGTITALSTSALVRPYPSFRWPLFLLDSLAGIFFLLLFFLFPDGRFVPRWARVIAIALVSGMLIDVLLLTEDPLEPSNSLVEGILWLVGLLVGVLTQIYRYRRVSTPTQRQQTKWIMFGMIILLIVSLTWSLLVELFPPQSGSVGLALKLGFGIAVLLFMIFPISVVFSILRYRLWDIDIVINRALVYGLLAGTLALLYFGSVVLLQSLFQAFTGQGSTLTSVVSTLMIAALFNPLRRRIQNDIDRRFFRRKYDAEKVLAAFAVTMRDEVDLDRLGDVLVAVVEETMQPEHVSYWLAEREQPIAAYDGNQQRS
jgi:hypothetical protein